ncbi:hypothetical protein K438DRAFT_1767407 [Mycena galopus ATCC 62051]|nr:hypothetical protein K438DRAFT_1767407 [Mycena galopus ATCC 62051]
MAWKSRPRSPLVLCYPRSSFLLRSPRAPLLPRFPTPARTDLPPAHGRASAVGARAHTTITFPSVRHSCAASRAFRILSICTVVCFSPSPRLSLFLLLRFRPNLASPLFLLPSGPTQTSAGSNSTHFPSSRPKRGSTRGFRARGPGANFALAASSAGVSKAAADEEEEERGQTMRTRRRSGKGEGKRIVDADREAEEEEGGAAEVFVKRGVSAQAVFASVCRTLHVITPVFATIGIANRGRLCFQLTLYLQNDCSVHRLSSARGVAPDDFLDALVSFSFFVCDCFRYDFTKLPDLDKSHLLPFTYGLSPMPAR